MTVICRLDDGMRFVGIHVHNVIHLVLRRGGGAIEGLNAGLMVRCGAVLVIHVYRVGSMCIKLS